MSDGDTADLVDGLREDLGRAEERIADLERRMDAAGQAIRGLLESAQILAELTGNV